MKKEEDLEAILTIVLEMSTFVLIMSTMMKSNIAAALFPKSTQEILRVLFSGELREIHLRGIEQATGQSPGTLQRVLDRFVGAGIVVRRKSGNQVLYQANSASVVYNDLANLVKKTFGIAEPIRVALSQLKSRVAVAFIYGSIARNEDTANSDIDLLVIGDARLQEVVSVLATLQEELGREINPITYSVDEYSIRLSAGNHFLSSIRTEPKIFLIGGQDELDRLSK